MDIKIVFFLVFASLSLVRGNESEEEERRMAHIVNAPNLEFENGNAVFPEGNPVRNQSVFSVISIFKRNIFTGIGRL